MKLKSAICFLGLLHCAVALGENKAAAKAVTMKLPKATTHIRVAQKPRPLDMDSGIPEVYTAPGYATVIELPEDVKQFAEGDAKRWVVACGVGVRPGVDAGAKNLCAVKPGKPEDLDKHIGKQSTSVTVIGVTGAIYPFHLVPADGANPVDLVTFVRAAPRRLLTSVDPADPDLVPRSDLAACHSDEHLAKAESAELRKSLDAERRKIEGLVDPYRVAFDYQLSQERAVFGRGKIGTAVMFHDDHRTFLRISGSPVVHSGGRDLIPSCAEGLCVVSGVLDRGYFVTGARGRKIKFQRKTRVASHA
jgi:hypothetical protein